MIIACPLLSCCLLSCCVLDEIPDPLKAALQGRGGFGKGTGSPRTFALHVLFMYDDEDTYVQHLFELMIIETSLALRAPKTNT